MTTTCYCGLLVDEDGRKIQSPRIVDGRDVGIDVALSKSRVGIAHTNPPKADNHWNISERLHEFRKTPVARSFSISSVRNLNRSVLG